MVSKMLPNQHHCMVVVHRFHEDTETHPPIDPDHGSTRLKFYSKIASAAYSLNSLWYPSVHNKLKCGQTLGIYSRPLSPNILTEN